MTATRRSRAGIPLLELTFRSLLLVCLSAGTCFAQQSDPAEDETKPDARPAEASADGAAETPADGGVRAAEPAERAVPTELRRIARDGLGMRCFGTEQSPVYGEVLERGTVVEPVEELGEFTRIRLPEGPIGFVHSDFATEPDLDGMVRSKGSKVSFRYRPRSDEAPVLRLEQDTRLAIVGRAEDRDEWWRVRCVDAPIWVKTSDLQPIEDYTAASEAWRELGRKMQAETRQWAKEKAMREAAEAAAEARREQFEALRQRVVDEAKKAYEQQDFRELLAELDAYSDGLAADAPEREAVGHLREEVQHMDDRRRAALFVKTAEPPAAERVEVREQTPRDPLREFDAVGWVVVRKKLGGPVQVSLEKGGSVRFYLESTSGRYDLTQFEGLEIAVAGPTHRPHLQSVRTLDVERIEVVGGARR
jgi:SH3-like domain-containing protein